MSALIEEMLGKLSGKADDEEVSVKVSELRQICSQATARAQMIAIYEQMLTQAAPSLLAGTVDQDLARVILNAIAR
jgi:hypothetical protein